LSASSATKTDAGLGIRIKSWGRGSKTMNTAKYVYWQDEVMWLGYLEEYPDYRTQGETKEELEEK